MKRILIDVSQIIYGTGVSFYTKELVSSLLRLDRENEYVLFGSSLRRGGELVEEIGKLGVAKSRVFLIPSIGLDILWNRAHVLPVERLVGKIDLYHSSDWAQAPSRAIKVSTIHDFSPLKYPQETHPRIVAVHKRRLKLVRDEVDCVIVPSKAIAVEALEFGIAQDKIKVITEASGDKFYQRGKGDINSVKTELGIVEDYVVAFGGSKRKNLERVIDVFRRLKREGLVENLVVVGNVSHNIKIPEGVLFVGYVPDEALAALYSGALALLYPSLYEGFGLPILQAFSCGAVVVTSDRGAMREVAHEAAVLVDPEDEDSILEGVKTALKKRNVLVKRGASRVKEFSWEKAARETLKVYNKL